MVRIKQQYLANTFKIGDPSNFQNQSANGQLEEPIPTATLKFDIRTHTFAEPAIVLKNLMGPIVGLHFLRHNSVVIDTTHGLIHFPHLTMQVKRASSETLDKPQVVLIYDSITALPMKTKTIIAFADDSSEWNTTGTVIAVENFIEAARLILILSISTIFDKNRAVTVTNTTKLPFSIKKNTQIANFSLTLRSDPNSLGRWTRQVSVWFRKVTRI